MKESVGHKRTSIDLLKEVVSLRDTNAKLLAALKAAGELWCWLPFDSGADIQEVSQRIAKLQRVAIVEAEKGQN